MALPNLILICDLERQLAEDFRRRSQYRESRELLLDALTLVDGRRSHTTDPAIEVAYARILLDLGHIAYDQECYEEALIDCRRAEKALEALVHVPERLEAVVLLDGVRRFIATLLRRDGLEELRREVMESHIRMLDGLNAHFGEDPALSLLAVLARSDLASGEGASTQLRAAILRFPANQRLPELFESRVADWIAFDINPFPSDPDTIGEPRGRLDPETRAIAIIKTLESRCEALSVYPAILPLAAYRVAVLAAGRGATQRKTGHLDDASRTSACLSAFANTLAQRDPNEPSFHLLLCEAFEQEGKMAWKGNDYVAIEAAWRKALGQAHDALLLDPQSNLARLKVAGLQDKLIGLASEPLSSR